MKGDNEIIGAAVKINQKDTTLLSLESTPCSEDDKEGDGNEERF